MSSAKRGRVSSGKSQRTWTRHRPHHTREPEHHASTNGKNAIQVTPKRFTHPISRSLLAFLDCAAIQSHLFTTSQSQSPQNWNVNGSISSQLCRAGDTHNSLFLCAYVCMCAIHSHSDKKFFSGKKTLHKKPFVMRAQRATSIPTISTLTKYPEQLPCQSLHSSHHMWASWCMNRENAKHHHRSGGIESTTKGWVWCQPIE